MGVPCRRLQENACCRQVPLCLGRQHYTECLGYFCIDRVAYRHDMVNGLLGYYIDNVFILSKIIVAVLVAFFWNYHLQRFFVYRNHNIKGFLKHYLENKKDEYEL